MKQPRHGAARTAVPEAPAPALVLGKAVVRAAELLGLTQKELARILGVAEYYDSIVSERPYRGGLKPSEAMQLVHNGGNILFDQDVVTAFEAVAPALHPAPESVSQSSAAG